MKETAPPPRAKTVRELAADQHGVVYAEFIMAFTPFFLAFLGIVQLALVGTAGLVVQTAAVKAVRAAAVVLDDDPIFYREEPTGLLDFSGDTEDDGWVNSVGGELTQNAGAGWLVTCNERDDSGRCCARIEAGRCVEERTNQLGQLQSRGGPRLRTIRRAAYLPLAAIAPEWEQVVAWFPMLNISSDSAAASRLSLRRTGIGTSPAFRLVTGFLVYNPIAAAVNFPTAPHADTLRNSGEDFNGQVVYSDDEPVTVRVTYLYPCGVPIASMLVCDSILGMTGLDDTFDSLRDISDSTSIEDLRSVSRDLQNGLRDQQESYRDFRRDYAELRAGAEYPDYLMVLLLARNARFHVLRREATLPIQGAPYRYPTEVQRP